MEEVDGYEMFDGLACPPLEDLAFNFVSDAAMNLDADIFFDDQVVEDVSTDGVPIRLERQPPPPRKGKGKELKRVVHVLKPTQDQLNWIAKCFLKEDDQEAQAEAAAAAADDDDPIVNKKKINIQPIKITAEQKGKGEAINLTKKVVLDESSIQVKFESTKRKLHDSYQRIEDAKKQKKIQLIEFQNPMPMPKPKPKPKPKAMGSMKKNCLGGKKCY